VKNRVSSIISEILAFVLGLISTYVASIIAKLLPIPDDLRFKVSYESKKIWKWIRNVPVRVTYTFKSQRLEITREDFFETIKDRLIQNNFRYIDCSGDTIIFQYSIGETEAELRLTPSYSEIEEVLKEESELLISGIQADLLVDKCKYRQFDGHMLDIFRIKDQIQTSLRGILGDWTAESLSCELRHMYKFTGILSAFKLSSLSGKIGNQRIDLSEKGLIVYGLVDQTLTSALKRIITFYY
jgi:hypothetical protein